MLHLCTLALACNGSLDEKVGDEAGVGQQGLGDRGGGVVLQPLLHGSPLVCVPICSYHRLHHHCLLKKALEFASVSVQLKGLQLECMPCAATKTAIARVLLLCTCFKDFTFVSACITEQEGILEAHLGNGTTKQRQHVSGWILSTADRGW